MSFELLIVCIIYHIFTSYENKKVLEIQQITVVVTFCLSHGFFYLSGRLK